MYAQSGKQSATSELDAEDFEIFKKKEMKREWTEHLRFDIENLAFVIADTWRGRVDEHRLHQVFDICQEGNLDRVRDVVALALARLHFGRNVFRKCKRRERVRVLFREYLTCAVLADWLSITLPEAAPEWLERTQLLLAELQKLTGGFSAAFRRRIEVF